MAVVIALPLTVSTMDMRVAHATAFTFPAKGELDCNGYSQIQEPLMPYMVCPDFVGYDGGPGEDNGHYVGHDEPSIQFFSNSPGSGNNVKWQIKLPKEHPLPAIQTIENQDSFWFSMVLCDPNSYPQNSCTPDSDKNPPARFAGDPTTAGSAILELLFIPPGSAHPTLHCDLTRWCAVLLTASKECTTTFCNPNCNEPINFAFIQMDGVPTGPPGPASSTLATFTPNAQTLRMNQGDIVEMTIHDTPDGLLNRVEDKTTRQSGFMVASAANGFQSLDVNTCAPTNFSFHPEFSTAKFGNFLPWGPAQLNIGFASEIGHFTPGINGDNDGDDAPCFSGPVVAGCYDFPFDKDFDGTSYLPDWPDGTTNTPTPLQIRSALGNGIGPVSSPKGKNDYDHPYGTFIFDTAVLASELVVGICCSIPPSGATFYPFYAQSNFDGHCTLTIGNDIRGATVNDFGRDAQYGTQNPAWSIVEASSGIQPNLCIPHA